MDGEGQNFLCCTSLTLQFNTVQQGAAELERPGLVGEAEAAAAAAAVQAEHCDGSPLHHSLRLILRNSP